MNELITINKCDIYRVQIYIYKQFYSNKKKVKQKLKNAIKLCNYIILKRVNINWNNKNMNYMMIFLIMINNNDDDYDTNSNNDNDVDNLK